MRKSTIRQHSFWMDQGLSLKMYLAILYIFAKKVPANIGLSMLEPDVSRNSLYQWYSFYRELMSTYLLNNPINFNNEIVEIDESKWGKKRKYNRGQYHNNHPWIFGMIGRESKKVAIFSVERRTAQVLIPKIQALVTPGSTIFSDDWAAYHGLRQHGYDHKVVVHKDNYVDPITGVHTNEIEGFWGHAKMPFKLMHGVEAAQLNSHLDEVMFRWNHKDSDIFNMLMDIIATEYNVNADEEHVELHGYPPNLVYRLQPQADE